MFHNGGTSFNRLAMNPPAPDSFGIGLIGAGAIGRMHAERCVRHPDVHLAAIADPTDAGRAFADKMGVRWFADHRSMLDDAKVGAAIVATPNATHLGVGLDCIRHGTPLLVEKPIADAVADAQALCDAADAEKVPLLIAHHRRHSAIQRRARELVAGGLLGRPVAVNGMASWLKSDSYFDLAWHRQAGGGPVLINLIHDIDQLRFMLGEIEHVQAVTSNAVRGLEVEDTAAVLLRFANRALGTLITTDAAVAPWNWDLAAGEAAHYPRQAIDSMFISGTEASLTLPRLEIWRYAGARGWHEPLTQQRSATHDADPYMEHLRHLRAVVEGREAPLCSGRDGLRTLQVALAVHEAARTQRPVSLIV
jgi:predicted dehydrogenase